MKNTTIRGIPDEVYDRIRQQAGRELRSVNAQIIHILQRATDTEGRSSPENVEDFITSDGRISLGTGKSIAPEDFARYVRYVYGPTTIKETQP
jgi:hypothetical protein